MKDNLEENYVTKAEFKPYKDRVNKLIGFLWAVLIGCGLIVVYHMLASTGLPTP